MTVQMSVMMQMSQVSKISCTVLLTVKDCFYFTGSSELNMSDISYTQLEVGPYNLSLTAASMVISLSTVYPELGGCRFCNDQLVTCDNTEVKKIDLVMEVTHLPFESD